MFRPSQSSKSVGFPLAVHPKKTYLPICLSDLRRMTLPIWKSWRPPAKREKATSSNAARCAATRLRCGEECRDVCRFCFFFWLCLREGAGLGCLFWRVQKLALVCPLNFHLQLSSENQNTSTMKHYLPSGFISTAWAGSAHQCQAIAQAIQVMKEKAQAPVESFLQLVQRHRWQLPEEAGRSGKQNCGAPKKRS